jgi:molybdopterin converting factor small subunit
MSHTIKVKFYGVFRKAYGKSQVFLKLKRREKLENIINKLIEKSYELKDVLIDPELKDPHPNAIILINGKEDKLLNKLQTEIANNDEIVFIPLIHGG